MSSVSASASVSVPSADSLAMSDTSALGDLKLIPSHSHSHSHSSASGSASSSVSAAVSASASASLVSASLPLISFDLFVFLSSTHFLHGLRHLDYLRYRRYCSRRIRRLRIQLGFTNKRAQSGAFQQRQFDSSAISDKRFFSLALLESERCWAYATQLKGELTAENGRPKFHALNKLSRAVTHARTLNNLSSSRGSLLLQLQCGAYFNWLTGLLAFEKSNHTLALQHFNHAARVYRELSTSTGGSAELATVCQSRLADLLDHIRLSEYFIKSGGGSSGSDQAELLALTEEIMSEQLNSQLAGLKSESMKQESKSVDSLVYRGRSIPLASDALRVKIIELGRIREKIAKLENEKSDEENSAAKLNEFSAAINCLDEIEAINRAESKTAKLDAQSQTMNSLRLFVQETRLSIVQQRNLHFASNVWRRLVGGNLEGRKKVKAIEEFMGIMEKLELQTAEFEEINQQALQGQMQVTGAVSVSGSVSVSASLAVLANPAGLRLLFSAGKLVALAEIHRGLNKLPEAAKFLVQATELLSQAKFDAGASRERSIKSEMEQKIQIAEALLRTEQTKANGGINKLVGNLTIKQQQPASSANASVSEFMIPSFPPDLTPAPCKPILFDLAFNHIEMPAFKFAENNNQNQNNQKRGNSNQSTDESVSSVSVSDQKSTQPNAGATATASGGFFGRLWGGSR